MINAWVPCEGAIRWREAGLRKLRGFNPALGGWIGPLGKAASVPSPRHLMNFQSHLQPECRKSFSQCDRLSIVQHWKADEQLLRKLKTCLPKNRYGSFIKYTEVWCCWIKICCCQKLIFLSVQLFCKLCLASLIGTAFLCFPVNPDFDSTFLQVFLGLCLPVFAKE